MPSSRCMHPVSFYAILQFQYGPCHCLQLEACLQRMLRQQLSRAFRAMRDVAQNARHQRRALAFCTQRSLAAALLAFRWGQRNTCRCCLQRQQALRDR